MFLMIATVVEGRFYQNKNSFVVASLQNLECEITTLRFTKLNRSFKTCKFISLETLDTDKSFTVSSSQSEKIEAIDLGNHHSLEILPKNVGETFPNLIVFKAWNCSISFIGDTTFKSMPKLMILRLDHNKIDRIHQDAFQDLKSATCGMFLSAKTHSELCRKTSSHRTKRSNGFGLRKIALRNSTGSYSTTKSTWS